MYELVPNEAAVSDLCPKRSLLARSLAATRQSLSRTKPATQAFSGAGRALAPSEPEVDRALAAAAAADPELAAAIAASMEDVRAKKAKTSAADDRDAIRAARLARFG